MSFPRYPAYKNIGVEWLGEVPEHWEVTALKRGFEVTLGKMLQPDSSSPEDELQPYLRAANIQWSGIDATEIKQMWLSKRDRTNLRLKSGDLLISEGGDVGRSCLWAEELGECYFQNSINRVRARNGYSNRYLYYWISTVKDKGYIDVLCNKSTIAHFTAEKVAAVSTPLPPSTEQTQIAAFLDRETAKIDELVAEQRRLMALLKEKRQAVISHAVTRGLNPEAPMKSSGVEWLGDVPAHWAITKLSRVSTKIGDGLHGTPEYVDISDFYFINGNNLADGLISITDTTRCVSEDELNKHRVELNTTTILLSINGTIGNLALYRGESVMLGKSAAYINCDVKIAREFLYWFLQSSSIKRYFEYSVTGTTIFNLSLDSIRKIPLALPPINDQLAIIANLVERAEKYDDLLSEAQHAIDLLQERRTALISAAVTGQIDVRAVAGA